MSDIESGKQIKASSFIDESAGVADAGKGVKLGAEGELSLTFLPDSYGLPSITTYRPTQKGDTTTNWTITNPTGNIRRFTWSGTGTNPDVSATTMPVGSMVSVRRISNVGLTEVTEVGSNFFEIDAATVVSTTSTGWTIYSGYNQYTKTPEARKIKVELVGGGGSGDRGGTTSTWLSGGGGGAYVMKLYNASDLNTTETLVMGLGGVTQGGTAWDINGSSTKFKSLEAFGGYAGDAPEGSSFDGRGGLATGGDLNIDGGNSNRAGNSERINSVGGTSYFSDGANPQELGVNGSGGGGSSSSGNSASGGNGLIIITEFF